MPTNRRLIPAAGHLPGTRALTVGTAGESLLWVELAMRSRGLLHVFEPELDRGLDAVVHRRTDGAYIGVQVKTRSELNGNKLSIEVYEPHLFTPDQLVIGQHLEVDRLGRYLLVATAERYRQLASPVVSHGRPHLVANFPLQPTAGDKWSSHLVALDRIAERLGIADSEWSQVGAVSQGADPVLSDAERWRGWRGEIEVRRELAALPDVGLFRPIPDLETPELLVRRLATGATAAIQIKTAELRPGDTEARMRVHRRAFTPFPTTWLVCLAWVIGEERWHDQCLVIPSLELEAVATNDGDAMLIPFRGRPGRAKLKTDRYMHPVDELAPTFAAILSGLEPQLGLRSPMAARNI